MSGSRTRDTSLALTSTSGIEPMIGRTCFRNRRVVSCRLLRHDGQVGLPQDRGHDLAWFLLADLADETVQGGAGSGGSCGVSEASLASEEGARRAKIAGRPHDVYVVATSKLRCG